jgi:DNA/RNA-binding domain of Phe-tRNA-synthetase-like protein
MEAEVPTRRGWMEPALKREFSGLGLLMTEVEARPARTPRGVKERLRLLSNAVGGRQALSQRREPIASAYRIFFRQIGIDPEESRPPAEAAMLERMRRGGFKSRNTVDDALLVAVVETGVPVRAFDADRLTGEVGLRISRPQERLGGTGIELREGTIVIADERDSIGLVFGETAPDRGVWPETRRMLLCALQVQGVPDISVDEALWTCAEILTSS